ncbi:hypothetical protein TIFTF001_032475 [Ficus carica]|uniref:AP2/ERF domain-containing protein n=1 Tax=Ficus carica TaxID=3494 RepID=A0AA88J7Z2_FICCA|nr:hypothetical protein TIFTF001_032475 [Ficus carica]
MWLRTFNMAVDASKAYGRAAFKLRGSKAILSFPLEAGKYDTINVIKELKEEKVRKYAGGIVSCSKNMQRLFGTPTAMVFFNIRPFTLHFS